MAALSITAANVGLVDGTTQVVTYGETVTQGQPLRLNSSDNEYYLCNHTTTTDVAAVAIALTPGGDGEKGVVLRAGSTIDIGATVAIGTVYCVGPSDGNINPTADLGSGDYVNIVGHAVSTSNILLTFNNLGVAVA